MIRRIAPHIDGNPVFTLEARRFKNGGTIPQFTRWTLVWFVRVFVVISVLWILWVQLNKATYAVTDFLVILFIASIGINVLLDFAAMIAAISTVQRIDRVYLDLVRTSLFHPAYFIAAHHALSQLRIWRLTTIVIASRITFVALFIIFFFFYQRPYFSNTTRTAFADFMESFRYQPFESMMIMLIVLIFGVTYMIEPLWRMRAVTALGLRLSARRSVVNAFLVCFAGLISVWITQGAIIALTFFLMINLSSIASSVFVGMFNSLFFILFSDLFTAGVIYFYYAALKNLSINRVVNRIYSDL